MKEIIFGSCFEWVQLKWLPNKLFALLPDTANNEANQGTVADTTQK